MRAPIRLASSLQSVVFDPCLKCYETGRTVNGLAADVAELFYASVRPYLKTIKAFAGAFVRKNGPGPFRSAAFAWTSARFESMAQIARLARERKEKCDSVS